MAQTDFKKLVAYSSISHMGYVMLGMAAFTPQGINGAVLQMFNHGTITAMLFLLVGVIYDRAHHRDIDGFGGLASIMPRLHRRHRASRSSRRWASRASRRSSPRCWCCSARGSAIPALTVDRGERRRADGGLHAVGAAAHVPRARRTRSTRTRGSEINGRELFTLVPLAVIVLVLGVYPQADPRPAEPALAASSTEQVKAGARPACAHWR